MGVRTRDPVVHRPGGGDGTTTDAWWGRESERWNPGEHISSLCWRLTVRPSVSTTSSVCSTPWRGQER
ncbi:hypothetical protein SprV_0501927400 [Sparganum proliferum]